MKVAVLVGGRRRQRQGLAGRGGDGRVAEDVAAVDVAHPRDRAGDQVAWRGTGRRRSARRPRSRAASEPSLAAAPAGPGARLTSSVVSTKRVAHEHVRDAVVVGGRQVVRARDEGHAGVVRDGRREGRVVVRAGPARAARAAHERRGGLVEVAQEDVREGVVVVGRQVVGCRQEGDVATGRRDVGAARVGVGRGAPATPLARLTSALVAAARSRTTTFETALSSWLERLLAIERKATRLPLAGDAPGWRSRRSPRRPPGPARGSPASWCWRPGRARRCC